MNVYVYASSGNHIRIDVKAPRTNTPKWLIIVYFNDKRLNTQILKIIFEMENSVNVASI